ncbi:response regulator [Candidatus Nitrosotenuis sp. DW1]|uniref:response regulator n=1 Tax=Candidatus Nitrosotenuis sp. DW1 TaxID=2259672 RepID=UPI0015C84F6D|nr:response regulator [Candidatus Nitrosotenuis sp. DW1]QLH08603.1 response regulator [Candidatus Nitrosotenuis sp. DW1]
MTKENPTVIVVDDDSDTIEIFEEYLKLEKIPMLAKGFDGSQAVELYSKFRPDVVLLDIMMPDFDGFYAIEKIRAMDPDSKFVILTADITKETKARLEKLNSAAVLYKPYEIDEIVQVIKKLSSGEILILSEQQV